MEPKAFTREQLEDLAIIAQTYSEFMKKGNMTKDVERRVNLAEMLVEAVHYGKVELTYQYSEPTYEDFKNIEYKIS